MSSCDRRTFALFLSVMAVGALTACGFAPVYGPGGTGTALRGKVTVQAPQTPDEYLLVRGLEDRLGRSGQPEYRLDFALTMRTQGQAVTPSNETTRYSIVGTADYTLTRSGTGATVASGQVRNFTGYSATGSTVETLAGERDARERLMTILADQIATQLFATADLSQ
ncbi:MAG: LPS assembly lipoprotein LptE [Jhaorihella sp.]